MQDDPGHTENRFGILHCSVRATFVYSVQWVLSRYVLVSGSWCELSAISCCKGNFFFATQYLYMSQYNLDTFFGNWFWIQNGIPRMNHGAFHSFFGPAIHCTVLRDMLILASIHRRNPFSPFSVSVFVLVILYIIDISQVSWERQVMLRLNSQWPHSTPTQNKLVCTGNKWWCFPSIRLSAPCDKSSSVWRYAATWLFGRVSGDDHLHIGLTMMVHFKTCWFRCYLSQTSLVQLAHFLTTI